MYRPIIAFLLLTLLPPSCMRSEAVSERPATATAATSAVAALPDSAFAALVATLSEPGGYFDSDNLVSNELSYQHVLGAMRRLKVSGGAYIGVGPDQNYTYIAQVRPKIAYMIDLRRDNLLQHLLYKSLFDLSRNRVEYLAHLLAKPAPRDPVSWNRASIAQIVTYLDTVAPRRELFDSVRALVAKKAPTYGIPLVAQDFETMMRIHGRFAGAGLDLQYESLNRPSRRNYPTFRDLILEADLERNQSNYFATEDDFQFVKSLHARNLIVPVVGNLAGEKALRAISRDIATRGERVSVLYVSNVEFYLMREGSFEAFAENVKTLPRNERSVIIRSYFNGPYSYSHPQWVPGYFSTQILQTVDTFVAEYTRGGYSDYLALVTRHSLPLR
jgi:hypothetical protein